MIREVVAMGLTAFSEQLTQILEGKPVQFSVEQVEDASREALLQHYPAGSVNTEFQFSGEIKGGIVLVLATQDAVTLAHAAMGLGEDMGQEFSEFERDVLSQAFQHAGEKFVAALADLSGKKGSVERAGIIDDIPDSAGALLSGNLTMGEELSTQFHLFVSAPLVELLASEPAGEEVKAEEPEAAEAPAAPEIEEPEESGQPEKEASPPSEEARAVAQPVQFSTLEAPAKAAPMPIPNLDLVLDVPMEITVELGRSRKSVREILELGTGSIVELDKLDGEPVDILANGKLFAKGEVVVIGETFGVRVVEIVSSSERLRRFSE